MKIIIKNAIIISSGKRQLDKKQIYIENDKIIKIADKIDGKVDEIIDAKGMLVLPGFIDIGCKVFENGYESKNNLNRLTNAGTKGGFTTITTASNTNPIADDKPIVEYILSKIKNQNIINLFPFGSMTKGGKGKKIAEIGEMITTGAIAISDGGSPIEDTTLLRDIFIYSKMFDITLVMSALDTNLLKDGVVNDGYMSTKLGLVGIPREAEEIEISRKIILAKYTKAKIHISNITTRGSVELIKIAKKDGVNITCSTSPHYFSLTDNAIDNYNTMAKVMPPLKEKDDIDAIKQGLKEGVIDAISSGHMPVLKEMKLTEFERADFGIAGIDVAFNITNTKLVKEDDFKIEQISLFMSENPAKILGFKTKGKIEEGYDADIIIVDENKKGIINSQEFLSNAKYSPYDNMEVFGDVLATIVSGHIFYNSMEKNA